MAVPILFEKMCGIIYQIYKLSKERDLKAQLSFDGMKKAFVSILQLYETNCTSKNIQWQASPPIDVMMKMILWENIEKSGGLDEYLTLKEVPWILSLQLS